MDVRFGSSTDIGRHRQLNEDAVLAVAPIFLVADGMGGHAAGEVAAALAIERFGTLAGSDDLRPDDVLRVIGEANQSIIDREAVQRETAGMGTTVSGLCLGTVAGSPHWFVFNVGDSRVYRLSNGILQQMTTDHSEVAELIAAGRITEADARNHPQRNVITRSLGGHQALVPDIWVLPVVEGERFLICSDGLPLEVDETQIMELLVQLPSPQDAADALVGAAVSQGGRDNVSAIVVDVLLSGFPQPADVTTAPRSQLEPAR